jgi:O-antigen ligase
MRTVSFLLSLVLIFAIPWENAIAVGGVNVLTRGIGMLIAAVWLVSAPKVGFRKPHPFHMVMFLFILWNIASFYWSFDGGHTVQNIKTYIQVGIMTWILWDLYTTPKALKAGLQAYVLGAYVSIGSTIFNYLTGVEYRHLRYSATGFNMNDLGFIVALGIPLAWHLAVSKSNGGKAQALRLVNFAYIPTAILAILLTASRGSLIAALPAFLFLVGSLTRLKLYQRVLLFVALTGSLFALLPLVPQSSFQRLGTTGTSITEADLHGRIDIWREGIGVFLEHPIVGIGSGAFRTAVESGKVAHNSFLSVLVEVGMIGFVLFAAILAIVVYEAMHQPRWDSIFLLTVLLVWVLGVSVHTWEQEKTTWLFLSLVVISASAFRGQTLRRSSSRKRRPIESNSAI